MNHSGTMRTPAFGIVPAKDAIVVTIEKPLEDHEQPVVITRQPSRLYIARTYRTKIVLQNDSDHPVGYMMIVVPQKLVALGKLPWQQLYAVLQKPEGRQALLQRLMQKLVNAAASANAPRMTPGDE